MFHYTLFKNIAANRCESSFAGLGYKHASGGGDLIVMELIINSKKHGPHTIQIDEEDLELISKYNWTLQMRMGRPYFATWFKERGGDGSLHRFLMGVLDDPSVVVDHKDGNPLNNKRDNLRVCTQAQNCYNSSKRAGNKSGFKGVFFVNIKPQGLWEAKVKKDGVVIARKQFGNLYAAALYYNQVVLSVHGEYARLNNLTTEQIQEALQNPGRPYKHKKI